jgi:hypothetical protein
MPRDISLNVTTEVDMADFASKFRAAVALLGNEPKMKTIEHADALHRR